MKCNFSSLFRIVASVFLGVILLSFTLCSANKDVLADMYNNPGRYITYGYVGTGSMVMIDRDSLNVHLYNPPYYIIAVNSVLHYSSGRLDNVEPPESVRVRDNATVRYRYDYTQKKIYIERYDYQSGKKSWELIETKPKDTSTASGWQPTMSGAEIAFYLAYGIPFYAPPIGSYAKEFIVEGISYLPLLRLSGKGRHYYDHRNKKIIIVK